jgi:predicted phage terminase large subunit-like protein
MVSARGRTVAQWEATKAATAPRFWTALFQGKPSPDVGDIWLREWWRRYDTVLWTQAADGSYRLDGYDVTQSWDCAFRETKSSDFVVGQVWAKKGADSFLVYQVWARLSFTNTIEAIRRVTRLFPQSRRKIIEAKANGDAVIDSLQHEIAGIIKAEPTQSKVARATAVSPFIRAGNVHLPTTRVATTEREIAFDVEAFIQQATSFPNAANDDAVDAASQYLNEAYLAGGGVTIIVPIGRIPLSSVRRQGLAPFQKRLNDRYLRR